MKLRYGTAEEAGMLQERIAKLEALQQEWINSGVSPIIVSLIARKGIIVSHKLFIDDKYNVEYGPLGIDAIFPLASISKAVTATAIMLLVEEGKVAVGLPVKDYIPEFDGDGRDKVLVQHLLTHTSAIDEDSIYGIMNSDNFSVDMSKCPENQYPDVYRYLQAGYKAALLSLPGKEMRYCNFGFTLLSEIIRRVSGKNIHNFTKERMFIPLGMKDTNFSLPDGMYSRVARHPSNAPFPHFADLEHMKQPFGSAGLSSTAYDMAVFCQMLLSGGTYDGKRILSKLSVEKMTSNQIPGVSSQYGEEFFKDACWGLGWNVSGYKYDYTGTLRSERTFSHSGRGNTLIMVDPVNDILTLNFQITMKRINDRAYHNFEYFNDAALACIMD